MCVYPPLKQYVQHNQWILANVAEPTTPPHSE